MKYVIITSKHHEGFAMFKSEASRYNIVDATPYGKDVIKALADECHAQGIKIGFYYSHARDWNEPDGLDNDWDFPAARDFQRYLDRKVKPQLTELLTQYGEVGIIWFDTPMNISRAQAQELKDFVRSLQPACIISGRLGGHVETDYKSMKDNSIPSFVIHQPWEVPATLNNTWGFKKNDNHWKSKEDITRLLFDIASKGGNYLLNVGPDAEGVIPRGSVDILKSVGDWMKVNHEAIYGTSSSPYTTEFSWGNITTRRGKLYLGIYDWPIGGLFYLEGLKNDVKRIYLLADEAKKPVDFTQEVDRSGGHHILRVSLPEAAPDKVVSVLVVEIDGEAKVEDTVTQQHDGTVTLAGVLGEISSKGSPRTLDFISRGGGAKAWVDPSIEISWTFKVLQPGTFKTDIISTEAGYADDPVWLGGHIVQLSSRGQSFDVRIVADTREYNQRSQYWKKIHTKGGLLKFSKPGTYRLTLKPVSFCEGELGFSFKEIRLLPAE